MDRIVRMWNPYVPQKPTAYLRGHNSPIAFIAIAGEDQRIFSIAIDKCVKVGDAAISNQRVVVTSKWGCEGTMGSLCVDNSSQR